VDVAATPLAPLASDNKLQCRGGQPSRQNFPAMVVRFIGSLDSLRPCGLVGLMSRYLAQCSLGSWHGGSRRLCAGQLTAVSWRRCGRRAGDVQTTEMFRRRSQPFIFGTGIASRAHAPAYHSSPHRSGSSHMCTADSPSAGAKLRCGWGGVHLLLRLIAVWGVGGAMAVLGCTDANPSRSAVHGRRPDATAPATPLPIP